MYDHLRGDVPQLDEALAEINNNNCTIVACFYISDSQQFEIIYEKPEPKQAIGFLTKEYER